MFEPSLSASNNSSLFLNYLLLAPPPFLPHTYTPPSFSHSRGTTTLQAQRQAPPPAALTYKKLAVQLPCPLRNLKPASRWTNCPPHLIFIDNILWDKSLYVIRRISSGQKGPKFPRCSSSSTPQDVYPFLGLQVFPSKDINISMNFTTV